MSSTARTKATEQSAFSTKTFPVVEIFGPTIQGEGALAGQLTMFVRFGGCDFSCSWCDSSHAVLPEEVRKAAKMTAQQIVFDLLARADPHYMLWVTLSGGNPALHGLNFLVDQLHSFGFRVAVETQGSMYKPWLNKVDLITISPKPPSSGMVNTGLEEFTKHLQEDVYAQGRKPRVSLKVPIWDEADLDFARALHKRYPAIPFYLSVVTAMGGLHGDFDGGRIDDKLEVIARYGWLVDRVIGDQGFTDLAGVFPQLHVLLWGHDRGH